MRKITPYQYAIFLYEITLEALKTKDKGLASSLSKGFLDVLAKNNDLGKIDKIIGEFEAYEKKQKGIMEVDLISAKQPLARTVKNQIAGALKDYKPEIREIVSPDLLGGITLIIGDMMIDGSLRRKVRELSKVLS